MQRGSNLIPLILALAMALATRDGSPAHGSAAASFAPRKIELQLRPEAARIARATRAIHAARRGWSPASAASTAAPDVAITRTGIASIDRIAAELSVATFEPEFRGETPPAPGSETTDFTAFYVVRWNSDVALDRALERFRALPEVASASAIAQLPVSVIPNDSLFAESWWFYDPPQRRDVHGPEAWDATTGDTAIVVGVLDTGVVPYHPDIGGMVAGNPGQIWTNRLEAAGAPNVDDDGNGLVDDVHGWDFVDRQADGVSAGEDHADQDPDPNDMAGHGTGVAGVLGALSNNGIGITGTAWRVRIMPLRVSWAANGAPLGLVDMSFVAQAIRYGTRMGASVLNCSFATANTDGVIVAGNAAIRAGVTIVAAAGNGGQQHDLASRPEVIAVASTDRGDAVSGFSNRGDYVDLAAPGAEIHTTFVRATGADSIGLRQPTYTIIDGTSFATPMVSGAAVLVQAQRRARNERALIPQGMSLRLTETADDITDRNPGIDGYGAGRLNLARALNDRPTSTAARTGGVTIGPAVVLPSHDGLERVAYVTSNRRLLIMVGQSADTLNLRDLPGTPLRQLAGGFAFHPPVPVPLRASPARMQHEGSFALFTGTTDGKILGFDDLSNPLPGWPVTAGGLFARPAGGPALGDLDGDGTLEVVCGIEDGNVMAWHPDGTQVTGFPAFVSAGGISSPVALADLDGDGAVEIVAAGVDGDVHVLAGDGSERVGWPVSVGSGPVAPVVTRFHSGGAPVIVVAADTVVHAFDPSGSERFAAGVGGVVIQDPALGDLDRDGVDEIVLALATFELAIVDSAGGRFAGSPIALEGPATSPPLVGPLSPRGRDLMVREGVNLAAFAPDGTRRKGFPKPGGAGFAPTLLDVDHDDATEVLAGTGSDSILYVYDAGDSTAVGAVHEVEEGAAAGAIHAGAARDGSLGRNLHERDSAGDWLTPRGDYARTGSRDVGPPSAVRNLRVASVADSSVRLTWTAPGNEGAGELPVTVEIRVGLDSLAVLNAGDTLQRSFTVTVAAGESLAFVIGALTPRTRYWFALHTIDAAGNVSRLSNVVAGTTGGGGPIANRPGAAIAPLARPSRLPVALYWRGGVQAAQRIDLYDITGRRVRALALGAAAEGVEQWNGRDDRGSLVPAGLYFARLTSGSIRVQTRVVLLP